MYIESGTFYNPNTTTWGISPPPAVIRSQGRCYVTGGKLLNGNLQHEIGEIAGVHQRTEISGGLFSAKVYIGHCAQHFYPTEQPDENGLYTVYERFEAENTTTGVQYHTLGEALDAVADGEEIALQYDIEISDTISISKNDPKISFSLDLNGHQIRRNGETAFEIFSPLTIKDSVGGGEISATKHTLVCYSGADVTLESGQIVSTESDTDISGAVSIDASTAVFGNLGPAKFTMNDGKIVGINSGVRVCSYEGTNAQFVMNGGEITGGYYGICYGKTGGDMALTINDGYIKGDTYAIDTSGCDHAPSFTILGGHFSDIYCYNTSNLDAFLASGFCFADDSAENQTLGYLYVVAEAVANTHDTDFATLEAAFAYA